MASEWEQDCIKWRGKVLKGFYAHYCYDWDELPVDETTDDMGCCYCFDNEFTKHKNGQTWFDFEPWYWGA